MKCKLPPFTRMDIMSIQEAKQKTGWNITAFDLPQAWKHTQGEGVKVAVLDTGCQMDHPDINDNLLPGYNFVTKSKKVTDGSGHGCVSPDCLVHTNYCGIETIETLYNRINLPEKKNYSQDGYVSLIKDASTFGLKTYSIDTAKDETKVGEIEYIHKMPINGEIVKITLEGNVELKLTPWHPVYIFGNIAHGKRKIIKKRADELKNGDKLSIPHGDIAGHLVQDLYRVKGGQYKECQYCEHIPKYFKKVNTKCKKCQRSDWKVKNKEYFVNEDLAYLVGLILTDGYIHTKRNKRVEITSITPEILNKVSGIVKSLGFNPKIHNSGKDTKVKRVIIDSVELFAILQNLGIVYKDKTHNCDVPEFVGKSPHKVICSFIAGVIDGDGCIAKDNIKNRIISASEKFVKKLCALFNSIGIPSSYFMYTDKRERQVKGHLLKSKVPYYHCCFSSVPKEIAEKIVHPKRRSRAFVKRKLQMRRLKRIKKIIREQYDGYFYDFTVKDNHTYIANGYFVSNTHCAGIICAENNDIGIVGVAPKSKVMPIKVLGDDGAGNFDDVGRGIRWAVNHGADLISMSLGCPSPVQSVRKAIQYADKKGVPVFCAAGNEGRTKEVYYPSNYPETIAVGSIDKNMNRSNFSNTGKNLDFMAPGRDILSTVPTSWYAIMNGTSMACPMLVGLAALLLSYKRNKDPSLKLECANDYRKLFKEHTTPTNNPKFRNKFFEGFGIVDARKLMDLFN